MTTRERALVEAVCAWADAKRGWEDAMRDPQWLIRVQVASALVTEAEKRLVVALNDYRDV